jgi:hypothetical protein
MRKIKLSLDSLSVESFTTAAVRAEQGTVMAHVKPSANDACPSSRGCTEVGDCYTELCETVDPALCPSADDACVSSRGCTEISC